MGRNIKANRHIAKEDRGDDYATRGFDWRYLALCGDEWTYFRSPAENPDGFQTCRKCNAAFHAEAAAATGFRLGKSLTDAEKEALGQRWAWRYLIPVTDDAGREWGWCALPGGWGERWEFVTWNPHMENGDVGPGRIGGARTNGSGSAFKFSSKEAILVALAKWIAAGEVTDRATRVAQAQERRVQAEIDRVEREKENAIRVERREAEQLAAAQETAEMLEGLRSIRDNLGAALSNFETDALERAITRLAK